MKLQILLTLSRSLICLRWVNECFKVCEDFFGLYKVDSTESEKNFATIKDVLLHLNLAISKVRGQCYDGASAISGTKSGVVKKMCDAEP